jgi:hypothetical protein
VLPALIVTKQAKLAGLAAGDRLAVIQLLFRQGQPLQAIACRYQATLWVMLGVQETHRLLEQEGMLAAAAEQVRQGRTGHLPTVPLTELTVPTEATEFTRYTGQALIST